MSRWSRVSVLCVLMWPLGAVVSTTAGDGPDPAAVLGPGANDPVALPGTANQSSPPSDAKPTAGNTITPPITPQLRTPEQTSAASHDAAAEIPERERKGLGKPNSLLSIRPAADQKDSSVGAITSLDPRTNGVTRVIGSLAVVLGLVLLLSRLARRMGGSLGAGGRPSGVVEILARYPIARNQNLLLLKLDRRILLLHRSGSAMTMLTEVSSEEEVASLLARIEAGSRDGLGARFQGLLERFNAEHRNMAAHLRGADVGADNIETIDLTKGRSARSPAAIASSSGRHERKGPKR